jgi:hypothetical protein
MRRFAKPLYGLTPVPRVRIPPSPPDFSTPVDMIVYLKRFFRSLTSIAVSESREVHIRCILQRLLKLLHCSLEDFGLGSPILHEPV